MGAIFYIIYIHIMYVRDVTNNPHQQTTNRSPTTPWATWPTPARASAASPSGGAHRYVDGWGWDGWTIYRSIGTLNRGAHVGQPTDHRPIHHTYTGDRPLPPRPPPARSAGRGGARGERQPRRPAQGAGVGVDDGGGGWLRGSGLRAGCEGWYLISNIISNTLG